MTQEDIEAVIAVLLDPKAYNLELPAVTEVFEACEEVTAKHLVYAQYLIKMDRAESQIPKLCFYIMMDRIYTPSKGADGYLGYAVKLINP
jgi:hypothetical protein